MLIRTIRTPIKIKRKIQLSPSQVIATSLIKMYGLFQLLNKKVCHAIKKAFGSAPAQSHKFVFNDITEANDYI